MKNKDIVSALIGSAFFTVPYIALSIPAVPSLIVGAGAFCAGELVLNSGNKKSLKEKNYPLYLKIEKAKKNKKHINSMIPLIENKDTKSNLEEICDSIDKIIKTVEKNPKAAKKITNFFDYYLPTMVKIVDRYDNIENQRIESKDSKKFMDSANKMIIEADKAFKNILNSLYQSDMIDTDVELKVFNSMIKADGFDDNEIIVKNEGDE